MLDIAFAYDKSYNNGTKFSIFIPIENFFISYKETIINKSDSDLMYKPDMKGNINFGKENFVKKINLQRSEKITSNSTTICEFKKNDYPIDSNIYARNTSSIESIIEENAEVKYENIELNNLKDINSKYENFDKDRQNYKIILSDDNFESDSLKIKKLQTKKSKFSNTFETPEFSIENRNNNDISFILDERNLSENKDTIKIKNLKLASASFVIFNV